MKQKIQSACLEPRPSEELIQGVILRARAVAMGAAAQKLLETAPAQDMASLASRAVIGQLAAAAPLPRGTQPEQLARQLEQQPAFIAALRGGHVAQRLSSGELLRQITGSEPSLEPPSPGIPAPKKDTPTLG